MQINWIGEILDTTASLSGKYARWLNIKKRKICFIVWGICATYWAIRSATLGLYSQALFGVVSVGFHTYGWLEWRKENNG